ncbi:MAG: glycosyl transferase [Deltaproteobacteria bacterium]|nr:glycosyl transferase [Deltaproteobacteria bacterium]
MISIVIPAHNEGRVLGRCLEPIVRGACVGELEVIVVCNGCTDDTADVAREFGPLVRVLETDRPSKNYALNLGDAEAKGFPRFFVDADIVLPLESIRRVSDVLEQGRFLGAAPRMRVDLSARSWPIRAFYDIWMRTPYVNEDMLGCGVYAISEEGRKRFDRFPDIIADDCFVRLLFDEDEKTSVDDAWFLMTPPQTLHSLIHINVRRAVGMLEMAERHPETTASESDRQRKALGRIAIDPRRWSALAVYVYAKLVTTAIFALKKVRGRHKEWNRDETSR